MTTQLRSAIVAAVVVFATLRPLSTIAQDAPLKPAPIKKPPFQPKIVPEDEMRKAVVRPGQVGRCRSDADCEDGVYCNGVGKCRSGVPGADFRGCIVTQMCQPGRCDEGNKTCIGCDKLTDLDGDGVQAAVCGGSDCDDNDARRYPQATEVCDQEGHDEDCDPCTVASVGAGDQDRDGQSAIECKNGNVPNPTCDLGKVAVSQNTTSGIDCDDRNAIIGRGSQVCANATTARVCDAGGWKDYPCPGGGPCQPQPNGLGVCVPAAAPKP